MAVRHVAAALLARCRNLRIVATSRERIGVDGEQIVVLGPLAADGPSSPAVELLTERIAARGGARTETPPLVDIAQRVDGLPLALELVAGRCHSLGAAEVLGRLDTQPWLLSDPTLPNERHRTIDAVLQWSYDLLSDIEGTVLQQLSVFPSSFTLAAAERVVTIDSLDVEGARDAVTARYIDEAVSSLVERSLVERHGDRFRLLETTRQFAARRLVESGRCRTAVSAPLTALGRCGILVQTATVDPWGRGLVVGSSQPSCRRAAVALSRTPTVSRGSIRMASITHQRSSWVRRSLAFGAAVMVVAVVGTTSVAARSNRHDFEVTEIENLAYGPATPGNLLDLHVPDVPGKALLPLVIWQSGSAWFSNTAKDSGEAATVAAEFTARGYAVATISTRSSSDARFPAQGHDVRAAIRWLRENAVTYGIDPDRFAFMGTSSGGWATAFAATTSDTLELPGEQGVDGTSSAVQVAVAFYPPTDFLSMDSFAAANDLPMGFAYPHDSPTSPESLLIECPGEVFPTILLSIQDCPAETEQADPTSYVDGAEIPIWVLHGLADPLVPFNQSRLLYDATTGEGNEARFTLVPTAGHNMFQIVDAAAATTWSTNRGGHERVVSGAGPSWDDIDRFLHVNLSRSR